MLPGVGAVVGGSLDLVETKIIADRAYKWFFTGDFSDDKVVKDEFVVEVDESDFNEL